MATSVLRAARVISLLTLSSRALGLVRDVAFSHFIGAGSVQSAFALGFQIPNLFRTLFGEGALSAASIPVLTEKLHKEGAKELQNTAGKLVGLLLAVLTVLCVVAELVVGALYLKYRYSPDTALTLKLTAIMLPFVIFICPVAVMGGIQNIFGRFALTASMPIVNNFMQISFALGLPLLIGGNPRENITFIAYSVLLAGIIQLVLQWWGVRKCGLRLRLSLDHHEEAIRRIIVTTIPMTLALGIVQFNTFMDSMIAWWFVIEPIGPEMREERPGTAILTFAQRLYQFPLGVFLVALATAIFPALARHASAADVAGLGRTLTRGIRASLFISVPCMVGLIFIREPLVRVLFHHGAFKEIPHADTRVAFALAMYCVGLWSYGLNQLMTRAFYAMHNPRTPLTTAVCNAFLNLTLNLILVQTPMREAGLALATAIGSMFQFSILSVIFHRRICPLRWAEVVPSGVRTLAGVLFMSAVLVAVDTWLIAESGDVVRLGVMVVVGAASYLAAVLVLRCPEVKELLRR